MTDKIDRVLAALLLLGAVLHVYGSFSSYPSGSQILIWALSGSLAAVLLAILNLVRTGRPKDYALALITFLGCLGWAGIAIGFGCSIGNVLDARVIWHFICALGLAGFSLRAMLR